MKKFKLYLLGATSMLSSLAFCVATYAWFAASIPGTDDNQIVGGEVGLRTYFYEGNGTEGNPYEIVSPIHFYNLTRLQNLGVFENKTYFNVGHIFDPSIGYQCMNPDGHGGYTYDKYLDMSSMSDIEMLAIGGEGAPFYGVFDGHNVPIVNLEVSGYPEDIGVFGYIASNASVENLVLKDLTINSFGYNSSKPNMNQLFGSKVDEIFAAETERFIKDGGIKFTNRGETINLKNPLGLGSTTYENINDGTNVNTIDDVDYSKFYFTEYHPAGTNFTYSWRFSTTLLEKYVDEETKEERARMNFSSLENSEEFNSKDVYVDTRISLIASIIVDGYSYSRVVQSYLCRVQSNNSTYDEGNYKMSLFCDFVTGDHTNYHHGTNIGFIAGHVDGKIQNVYLYNGTLNLNNGGLTPIKSESQVGLIGEIGSNVINDMSPEIALQLHGDTGVMNFSKIYDEIRGNYNVGDKVWGTFTNASNGRRYHYTSYDDKLRDTNQLYREYLRYDASTSRHFITKSYDDINSEGLISVTKDNYSSMNSVDFLNNKIIADEDNKDRGLGIFKIATSHNDIELTPSNLGTAFALGLGESRIRNELTPKTQIYYSTAEIDHTKFGESYMWNDSTNQLNNVGSEPSWSSVNTFSSLYERDFDYIYEMDLSQISATHGNNYFYNTKSEFLTNYFSSKLIDKYGASITPETQRFGFMFRSSENEVLNGLSSYMPVGYPTQKFAFEEDGLTYYYPSNSIVFTIENPNGANVSVVGSGDDITIYGFNSRNSENRFTKKYTMHSSKTTYQYLYHTNGAGYDMCRYFRYDAATGNTDSKAVDRNIINKEPLKRDDRLYAHIFKLPQGEYCIGANHGGQSANIYFLSAQGQTEGTIGATEMPIMDNSVKNVDFILNDPITNAKEDFILSEVSMSIEFNIADGVFIVDSSTGNLKIIFDERNHKFVDFLLILDKKDSPYYLLDNAPNNNNLVVTKKGNSYRGGA